VASNHRHLQYVVVNGSSTTTLLIRALYTHQHYITVTSQFVSF